MSATTQSIVISSEPAKQLLMSKDEAITHFGFKNHEALFQKILKEFKEHEIYGEGYNLITYKVVLINIELFTQFLNWRGNNKFKRRTQ